MTGIVAALQGLPPLVLLAVAVVLVAGETGIVVGLLFPVELTLMTVGFLAYLGEVPFLLACLLMIAAATLGDALALRSGRRHGARVRASPLGRRVGERRWARADRMLHRYGGRSVFIARWVPFVRTLLPRLAGSAGMSYRTFVPWNLPGVVTQVGSSVLVGYLAGVSYVLVADAVGRATTALLLLAALVLVLAGCGRWLGRHPARWPRPAPRTRPWLARGGGLAAAGLAVLGFGLVLTWAVRFLVDHSGLSGVDSAVSGWFADRRDAFSVGAAEVVATLLGGAVPAAVVVAAGVATAVAVGALVLRYAAAARSGADGVPTPAHAPRPARSAPARLAGVAGAFLPLPVLAAAADLAGGDAVHRLAAAARPLTGGGQFSTHSAVAVAGLCGLAWIWSRRRPAAGWSAAGAIILSLVAARLYLGWDTASTIATAVLLGALWPVVFLTAGARRCSATTGARDPAHPADVADQPGEPAAGGGTAISRNPQPTYQ